MSGTMSHIQRLYHVLENVKFHFPTISKANTVDMQTSEKWTALKPFIFLSLNRPGQALWAPGD